MDASFPTRSPASTYTERALRFEAEAQRLKRFSGRISWGRLAAFLLALFGLLGAFWELDSIHGSSLAIGLGGIAIFVGLLVWHEQVLTAGRRAGVHSDLNREGLARLERRWENLPVCPIEPAWAEDPLARDLDLFEPSGQGASLFRLLGGAASPFGRRQLADWLLHSSPVSGLVDRQAAVRALAPAIDWRQEFGWLGRELNSKPHDPEPFLRWAENPPWLLPRTGWLWLARGLALLTLVLLGLYFLAHVPPLFVFLLPINLLVTAYGARRAGDIFEELTWRERGLESYRALFLQLETLGSTNPGLSHLVTPLLSEGLSASRWLARLGRLQALAELRRSIFLYLPLQSFLLWDFHLLERLERWQLAVGLRVRGWFQALGQTEALVALATLHHDHPDWCFPVFASDDRPRLNATGLGHPLLSPDQAVVNDVSLGEKQPFLLVTGSNMAGKSTLLRSLGLATVLAQSGGPVFAKHLTLTPFELGSGFRIHDSLAEGVSRFMAELKRVKAIVDVAKRCSRNERSLLFLLDEVLLGTNVSERQLALRRVIGYLLDSGALGALATHDLSLAEAPEFTGRCQPVYFTEGYEADLADPSGPGLRMVFDYRLRSGIAPSHNALKLLELVGLPTEPKTGDGGPKSPVLAH